MHEAVDEAGAGGNLSRRPKSLGGPTCPPIVQQRRRLRK